MKILDRYILKSMLESYVICIVIVLSFYIIIDLFSNFDKFDEYVHILQESGKGNTSIMALIFRCYLYQTPLIFYNLSPIVTLMAGAFTATRMSRSNELTPLKSCGIPVYRIIYPFAGFALFISLFMGGLQEYIIPAIAPQLDVLEKVKHGRKLKIESLMYCDRRGKIFYIGSYYPPLRKLENVRVTVPHSGKQLKPHQVIEAQLGGWRKEGAETVLFLKNGVITTYDQSGGVISGPLPISKEGYIIHTDLRDRHLTYQEETHLDMISSSSLRRILKKKPDFAAARVTLHSRLTLPLSNILLLLLGLPLMLRQQSRNFFIGTGICAIVSGAFYGLNILFLNLGYKEVLNPIFAAWFPTVTFASLAASFVNLMHT